MQPANGISTASTAPATTTIGGLPNLAKMNSNVVNDILGSVNSVRIEIDDALADMREFHRSEPDQVMQAVSAHAARLTEIVIQISRIEVQQRQWKPIREEAERVISALKDQFQIASRAMFVRELDFRMAGGGA